MLPAMKHAPLLLAFTLMLGTACGKVVAAPFDDNPDSMADAGPPWAATPCPLLALYISEWQIRRIEPEVALHRFLVLLNQSSAPIDMRSLYVGAIGDTHPTVDVDGFIEPDIGSDEPLWLPPGGQIGGVSPSVEEAMGGLLLRPAASDRNLAQLHLTRWTEVSTRSVVSAEVLVETADGYVLPLQLRFWPGEETLPLRGDFACAL